MSFNGYTPFIYNAVSLSPFDNSYLSLSGINYYPRPFKLISGIANKPSLCCQADTKTGLWFPEEGCISISLIGFDTYRFYHNRIEHRNKFGAKTTMEIPSGNGRLLSTNDNYLGFHTSSEPTETIYAGMAVRISTVNNFERAKADDLATLAFGVASEDTLPTEGKSIQLTGYIDIDDWTNVTGGTLLTPGAWYYLSDTDAGKLTDAPPTIAQKIGYAISTTRLMIKVS